MKTYQPKLFGCAVATVAIAFCLPAARANLSLNSQNCYSFKNSNPSDDQVAQCLGFSTIGSSCFQALNDNNKWQASDNSYQCTTSDDFGSKCTISYCNNGPTINALCFLVKDQNSNCYVWNTSSSDCQ